MSKEKFLAYFQKKSHSKDETDGIQITIALTSVTENVTSAELAYDQSINQLINQSINQTYIFQISKHESYSFSSKITSYDIISYI